MSAAMKVRALLLTGLLGLISSSGRTAPDVDIGLIFTDAAGNKIKAAGANLATDPSPLRIQTSKGRFGVKLVALNDPNATKVHVATTGGIRAVKKYVACGEPVYAGYGGFNASNGVYSFTINWKAGHKDAGGEQHLLWAKVPSSQFVCQSVGHKCGSGPPHHDGTTAAKLCEMQGYSRVVGYRLEHFKSPKNNDISTWNGSQWLSNRASAGAVGNNLMWALQCACGS
jgi:hypothetical protein